jgi:hypothetical protein
VLGNPRGSVHKSVDGSLSPCKIMLPLYRTVHLCLSNVTLHPELVKILIPKSDAMDRSRMICPVSVKGRPFISMSHICVDITCWPLASVTFSGVVVGHLLTTGTPSITKICIAPESMMD